MRDKNAENELRIAETEIDLLGIGRGAKEYLVGECKFKHSPFDYSEYLDTIAKLIPQKEKAKFYYALFSESGFDDKIAAESGACRTVSAEQRFSGLDSYRRYQYYPVTHTPENPLWKIHILWKQEFSKIKIQQNL